MKIGDLVIVTATHEQLREIGILSDSTFEFLMDGKPKRIDHIVECKAGDLIYVLPMKDHMLWVRRDMVRPYEI